MPFAFLRLVRPVFAPDDAAAAAPAPAAAAPDPASAIMAAARAATGQAVAEAAATPAAPTLQETAAAAAAEGDWKAPDFVPDNLRGKTADETFKKLTDAWKGYREKESKRESLPADPSGYAYKPGEKVAPFVADELADDPVFQSVREAALEAEIAPSKFNGFLDKVFGAMVDLGVVDRPVDPQAVLGGMVPEAAKSLPQDEQMRQAGQRVLAINGALQTFAVDQKLTEGETRELNLLVATDDGLRLLERLLPRAGAGAPAGLTPGGAQPTAQTVTKDSVRQRQADPRNQPGNAAYDPAFQRETVAQYRRVYGANG
jgi:hypothetical protein